MTDRKTFIPLEATMFRVRKPDTTISNDPQKLAASDKGIGRGQLAAENHAELNNNPNIPVVFFSITDLCNSRCNTCDYWQNKDDGGFLNRDTILSTVDDLTKYNPQTIYFTGGEPLLRGKELFQVTDEIRQRDPDMQLRLYTNGILLGKYADDVVKNFDIVNVSIDSFDPAEYKKIRGVNGLPIIKKNIGTLKEKNKDTVVRVNTVIQKGNFRELPDMIEQTGEIGANFITFLPLDYKSESFSRKKDPDLKSQLLDRDELAEFSSLVNEVTSDEYLAGHPMLRESGNDLKRVVKYYEEVNGIKPSENPACDTPENTVIIDSEGSVRLCFFTDSVGSLRTNTIDEVLTSDAAKTLKQEVKERRHDKCVNCICPLEYRPSTVGITRKDIFTANPGNST